MEETQGSKRPPGKDGIYQYQFYFMLCYFIFLILFLLFIYLFILCFLGPQAQHMEIPRLGVESELQLLACATVQLHLQPTPQLMAMPDP